VPYRAFIYDAVLNDMEIICRKRYLQLPAKPGGPQMLDLTYILIGAAFLGACVLYAVACDHL